MDKQTLLSTIISGFNQLGINYNTGQRADITITCEFLDAGWSTGNKKITYEASIFADETSGTVYMWEFTREKGSGISFGGDSESSFQTGTTLYRKVKSVQYSLDGKAYETSLNLGAIPKTVKGVAKDQGWKFKTVLKKEKASYPADYTSNYMPMPSQPSMHEDKMQEVISCSGCGKSITAGERFCHNCGRPVSTIIPSTQQENKEVNPTPNQEFFRVEAKAPNKQKRFGKTITISLFILAAVIIGMFWLMKVSFLGWIIAIGILTALYFLSGRLSQKGRFPLILLWLIGLVVLFLVFILSPNSTSSAEKNAANSAPPSAAVSSDNTKDMSLLFSAILNNVRQNWKADAKISKIWTDYFSEDFRELKSFTSQDNWNVKFYSPSSNAEIDILLRYEYADQEGLPGIVYFCQNSNGEKGDKRKTLVINPFDGKTYQY